MKKSKIFSLLALSLFAGYSTQQICKNVGRHITGKIDRFHEQQVEDLVETCNTINWDVRRAAFGLYLMDYHVPTENSQIKDSIYNLNSQINPITNFFDEYCPLGSSDNDVTTKNYLEVLAKLNEVQDETKVVIEEINRITDIMSWDRIYQNYFRKSRDKVA